MSEICCNLCGSTQFTPLVIGEPVEKTGTNVICQTCGLICHSPVMTAQQMKDFYAREYSGEYSASEAISRELAQTRIAQLQKYLDLKDASPALEIGCAQGEFLAELNKLGVDATGVEPSEAMVALGKKSYDVEILNGIYDDLPEKEDHYGLINLFHVLEHVADPLATLKRIRREIRDDGTLFLEVPTLGDCQLAIIFKTIHPTTFVRSTLEAMLTIAGFEPLMVDEKGYHLRVVARPVEPEAVTSFPEAASIGQRVEDYVSRRRAIIDVMMKRLKPLVGCSGGAVYGAGLNTLDLDQIFPLEQLQLNAAFDMDPRKQGQEILGLPIKSPDELKDWQGKFLIISSYRFQEEICEQLTYLEDRGVELVSLYDKSF